MWGQCGGACETLGGCQSGRRAGPASRRGPPQPATRMHHLRHLSTHSPILPSPTAVQPPQPATPLAQKHAPPTPTPTCSTSTSCFPNAALRLRSMPIFMVAVEEGQVPHAPCGRRR